MRRSDVHRVDRGRRVRRAVRGACGLRVSPARGLCRPRRRTPAVRGDHRVSSPAPDRARRGAGPAVDRRAARPLRLRGGGARGDPARARARRRRVRVHPRSRQAPGAGGRAGRGVGGGRDRAPARAPRRRDHLRSGGRAGPRRARGGRPRRRGGSGRDLHEPPARPALRPPLRRARGPHRRQQHARRRTRLSGRGGSPAGAHHTQIFDFTAADDALAALKHDGIRGAGVLAVAPGTSI